MTVEQSSVSRRLWLPLLTVAVPLLSTGGKIAKAQTVEQPEEITVTGTRLRRTDGMAEPVPVTTLTPEELQLFEPGSTIAEQLDALPQFFLTSTAQRGGPALFGNGGGSYLNMRGLGPERTLVLFDGFRMPPADKRGSVNVDSLPTALVRSVDVVTGGATAAYGADALGGVTNFILDRDFEGLKFNAGTGMNEFNNEGKNWNVSVAGGTRIGERLSIIGSFEARHVDQIVRDPADLDPSWFQRWGHVQNPAWLATDPPGTNPRRLTLPWVAPARPARERQDRRSAGDERAQQHEVQRRRNRHRAVQSRDVSDGVVDLRRPRRADLAPHAGRRPERLGGRAAARRSSA